MKITNTSVSSESRQKQSGLDNWHVMDTDKILDAAVFLQSRYGGISSLHTVYLDIVREIQVLIIGQLKDNQFDEPYFVACATANFVQEFATDLECQSKSRINRLISKFQSEHPDCEEKITSLQFDLQMMFDFMINYAADLEDDLRANAMVKSGISDFTQNDKEHVLSSLASVIYQHSKTPSFPKNLVGTYAEKSFEKIIKFGIKHIGIRHINKSASISKTLIQNESITNSQ